MTDEKKYEGYPAVRALTRKDRKKLSDLIKAFAERSGNSKLTSMLPGLPKAQAKGEAAPAGGEAGESSEQAYELIKSVMQGLLEWVEEDVTAWFMDLTGVTDRTAYDALPFDIEVYIIDRLFAEKGFHNFFTRASELYKKIRG